MRRIALLLLLSAPLSAQITNSVTNGVYTLNTVYQNTTGKLESVIAMVSQSAGSTCSSTININVGNTNPPTGTPQATFVSPNANFSSGTATSAHVVVPPLYYYKVTASSTGGCTVSPTVRVESTFDYISTASQSAGTCTFGSNVHNTSSGLWWIEAVVSPTSSEVVFTVSSDAAVTPTTAVMEDGEFAGGTTSFVFPVLAGNYYRIDNSAAATITNCTLVSSTQPLNMSQNIVTGSRSVGQGATIPTYFSGEVGIVALVSVTMGGIGDGDFIGYDDGSNPPAQHVNQRSKAASEVVALATPVQPLSFYGTAQNSGPPSLLIWTEYDIPMIVTTFAGEPKRRTMN